MKNFLIRLKKLINYIFGEIINDNTVSYQLVSYQLVIKFIDNRPYEIDKNGNNLPYDVGSMAHLGSQYWFINADENECLKLKNEISNGIWDNIYNKLDKQDNFSKTKLKLLKYVVDIKSNFTLEVNIEEIVDDE